MIECVRPKPYPSSIVWHRLMGGTQVEENQGSVSAIDVTRFTAEQWKSRAMYEEACKLQAERSLEAARDLLNAALFAAASSPALRESA
jgi:hypothetical protein